MRREHGNGGGGAVSANAHVYQQAILAIETQIAELQQARDVMCRLLGTDAPAPSADDASPAPSNGRGTKARAKGTRAARPTDASEDPKLNQVLETLKDFGEPMPVGQLYKRLKVPPAKGRALIDELWKAGKVIATGKTLSRKVELA